MGWDITPDVDPRLELMTQQVQKYSKWGKSVASDGVTKWHDHIEKLTDSALKDMKVANAPYTGVAVALLDVIDSGEETAKELGITGNEAKAYLVELVSVVLMEVIARGGELEKM